MHIEPDYSHGALFGFSICSNNQKSKIMSTTKETTVTTTETVPQTIEIPVQQGIDIKPAEVIKETVTKE